jgi:hypothetical protein
LEYNLYGEAAMEGNVNIRITLQPEELFAPFKEQIMN